MSASNEDIRKKLAAALAAGAGGDVLQTLPGTMMGAAKNRYLQSMQRGTPLPNMTQSVDPALVQQGPGLLTPEGADELKRILAGEKLYENPRIMEKDKVLLQKGPAKSDSKTKLADLQALMK